MLQGERVPEAQAECFLSAFGQLVRSAPKSAFECFLAFLAPKVPNGTGRCPKALEKHSVGHFSAQAPGHSRKWRQGSQGKRVRKPLVTCVK